MRERYDIIPLGLFGGGVDLLGGLEGAHCAEGVAPGFRGSQAETSKGVTQKNDFLAGWFVNHPDFIVV